MGNLACYLPPLAADFSGVCSVLFDLGGLVIMHDASCCTKNYVEYEEPRWQRERNTTFCSQLRSIDAILGNDEKLIANAVDAAANLKPPFIAVLGSPVPAIIGTDMQGIAREIEARTGVPTLGFDTNGFNFYDAGIDAALLQLVKKFAAPQRPSKQQGINLLGVTPLDFSANPNSADFKAYLAAQGLPVRCSMAMDFSLAELENIAAAQLNLVVAASAVNCAEYLWQKYAMPYVVATPLGQNFAALVVSEIRAALAEQQNRIVQLPAPNCQPKKTLIIGDWVLANSIRNALYQKGCTDQITVGSFLKVKPVWQAEQDIAFKNEKHLIMTLKTEQFAKIIGDPLFFNLPYAQTAQCLPLPHAAISSNLYAEQMPRLLGDDFEEQLNAWL